MYGKNVVTANEKPRSKLLLRGSAPHLELQGLLGPDARPYLMLNLPFVCNYRCLKCCNQDLSIQSTNPRKSLTLAEIREIFEEARENGYRVLVLAGEGEPLLDRRLRAIVQAANNNDLVPYIFTNGSLLNQDNVDFLASERASLIISLDSLDPLLYKRLYGGKADLSKVMASIAYCRERYRELIEQIGSRVLVSLAINSVINRLNATEVKTIERFCGNDIVYVCNRPTCIGLAEANWSKLYGNEPSDALDIERVLASLSETNGPLGTASDGVWCAYMKQGVSIGHEGSFLVCAYGIETAWFYGEYRRGSLKVAPRAVMRSLTDFYEQAGHSRCVLRHPAYIRWVRGVAQKRLYG
jgi:organic radical activating enzyme